ncbi:hypothetical protein D3C73_1066240 [compost metagenome]
MVVGHVLVAQVAAILLEVVADGVGDITLVESITPAVGNLLQGVCKVRVLPHLALARGVAVDGELFLETRILRQLRHRAIPVIGDHFGNGMTVTRVADGRGQVVGHRLATEPVVQREPAINRARHRYRQRAGRGDLLQATALELGQGE